jgi:hypothetical protein
MSSAKKYASFTCMSGTRLALTTLRSTFKFFLFFYNVFFKIHNKKIKFYYI